MGDDGWRVGKGKGIMLEDSDVRRIGGLFLEWDRVSHVLLDMDGTLLDKDFDDYFWGEAVPGAYAEQNGIPISEARDLLYRQYQCEYGTLQWNDVEYWGNRFGFDVAGLQQEMAHLVTVHGGVCEFLEFVRSLGKPLYLVTNAHPRTIGCKTEQCPIHTYFDEILSAFQVGHPKENLGYWREAHRKLGFEPGSTLLVDDNLEALRVARTYGIGHPVFKARASRTRSPEACSEFQSLEEFSELMKLEETSNRGGDSFKPGGLGAGK